MAPRSANVAVLERVSSKASYSVTCIDGTRVTDLTECAEYDALFGNRPTGGNSAGGGGGRGGGGGGNGNGSNGESNESRTPGVNAEEDAKVVKDCAAAAARGTPGSLFSLVAKASREVQGKAVPLSYGSLAHEGPTAMGGAYWSLKGGKLSVWIILDPDRIKENAQNHPGGRSYWHEVAEVLFHEYHHANDILNCVCGNPHERRTPRMTLDAYEDYTQNQAEADANAIASCLPD